MSVPSKIRKVVIPAAGIGSRFLPASKTVPKELFPIIDQPALQYGIDEALAAGMEEIIVVISPPKQKFFDGAWEDITTVIQEEPKGLGHAIFVAHEAVGEEPFAVILPDDLIRAKVPCLAQMKPLWEERGCGSLAVRKVPRERVNQYGIVATKKTEGRVHTIESLVEKPPADEAPSQLAVIGRYLLPSSIFSILENLPTGALGEIQLTDALQVLAEREGFLAYEFEGKHYDTGNPLGFIKANVGYGLAHDEFREGLKDFLRQIQ